MSTASDVEQPERRWRLRRPTGAEVLGALPTIATIRTSYRRDDLRADLTAGLALTAVLVPVGMGYAQAAGLPAIAGLYATIGALVGYFLVGPSQDPRLRPGLGTPSAVRGGHRPARGGRPCARDRPRRRDHDHGRTPLHRRGRGPARFPHRSALRAYPDRVHERHRRDHPGRPAAEAPRVHSPIDRGAWSGSGPGPGDHGRQGRAGRACPRHRQPCL